MLQNSWLVEYKAPLGYLILTKVRNELKRPKNNLKQLKTI